ncbi:MAG: response regulator [Flavobacteriales bacterium]
MHPGKIKIGLVQDQVLFREGMNVILGNRPELEIVFESSDLHSVPEKLRQSGQLPDVMLLDLSLPAPGTGGEDLTRALRSACPGMKVLILSVQRDESHITRLMELGAHGYLAKGSDPQEIYEAIMTVHTRGIYLNEETLIAIRNHAGRKKNAGPTPVEISPQEIEVLQLVCEAYTAEEIAAKLLISVRMVNGLCKGLLQKTGSRNLAGLVMYALRNGIPDVK